MIIDLVPAHVKPAPSVSFAPIIATLADLDFSDLGDEPTDAEYDQWADESVCMDLMEAGLPTW